MKKSVLRIFDLIKKGELKFMVRGIIKRVLSTNEAFGLKRDLNVKFKNPDALIEIKIRQFKSEDQEYFTADLQNDGLIENNISHCFVATTDDKPCFRQWLIGPNENMKIQEFWEKAFPILKPDEALLEGGFTIPALRRNGIMPAGITRIIDNRQNQKLSWVITFVGLDNIPSLKGCQRSGFYPYTLRTEKWFLFKRSITFQDVPKDYLERYSKNVISSKS